VEICINHFDTTPYLLKERKGGSVETVMYLSVRNRLMKIIISTKDPRFRASPRHGGQRFFEFFVSDPPWGGSPVGGAAFIVPDGSITIPVSE
jgi:hypothetical protein